MLPERFRTKSPAHKKPPCQGGFAVTNPKILEAGIKSGALDQFKITVAGREPAYVYVTLYAAGAIWAPKGFTTRGGGG